MVVGARCKTVLAVAGAAGIAMAGWSALHAYRDGFCCGGPGLDDQCSVLSVGLKMQACFFLGVALMDPSLLKRQACWRWERCWPSEPRYQHPQRDFITPGWLPGPVQNPALSAAEGNCSGSSFGMGTVEEGAQMETERNKQEPHYGAGRRRTATRRLLQAPVRATIPVGDRRQPARLV
mmetsp:Transcript_64712/g.127946  ORF Transcript_64712/g.127946 Transcript_64712/m.127946 type:complete len:178 (+) Transcript_64712:53-586(+)